jgi:secondary thiamine-phosphate synthase enzyme
MTTFRTQFEVQSGAGTYVQDITRGLMETLRGSTIKEGIVLVSVRHSTCALALNENEKGLMSDLKRLAETILDPLRAAAPFRHDVVDDNARAHLTSVLLGPSLTLPLSGGGPMLGSWQSVLLVESDGPRSRTVDVTVVG